MCVCQRDVEKIRWQQLHRRTKKHMKYKFAAVCKIFFNQKCRFKMWFLSLNSQGRLTPTAARRSRRAGWRSAAVRTECTSAPSPCPAPTSGMKPSTPARAAAHVRTCPRNQNPGKDLKPKFTRVEGIDPAATGAGGLIFITRRSRSP